MSHIVSITTEIRDPQALRAATERLNLPSPVRGEHRMFSGRVQGWAVQLPDWRYPVVCDTDCGRVHFDNYEGRWGDPQRLNQLLQSYGAEKAKIEARKQGYSVTEQSLSDGSIRLTVSVGGAT